LLPAKGSLASGLVLALMLLGGSAEAAPVTVGPLVVTVPDGFEAAQTQRLKNTLIRAWTKSVRDGSMKTLLQIDVIDMGKQPGKPPAAPELATATEKYLRQFLEDVERRRDRFVSSPVSHIRLAGLPASRASWNGALGGRGTVGVMYCVIVRNRFVVDFHTQDLGNTPSSGMFEAMKAIEAVTLLE
jgi:hypothetical protein